MSTHLDQFSDAERHALDALANLHDALREGAGTRRHFRAGSVREMQDYIGSVAACMDTVEADERLLAELGRRQLMKLNLCGTCGGAPEADLRTFYHDRESLRGAGLCALKEVAVNLRHWQDGCDQMDEARRTPPN
jgi:hypothetical protein